MSGKTLVLWCNLLFLFSCIFSCQVKRPGYVLTETQMEDILYDFHLAKAMGEEVAYSENYKRVLYIESVFAKHGTTKAAFDTSMVWYTRNPDALFKVYEQVNTRLRSERDKIDRLLELKSNKPSSSAPGDSIDVWFWQRAYLLTGAELENKLSYVLPADSNFKQRDTLRWSASLSFKRYNLDSIYAPIISMQLLYQDDDVKSEQVKVYHQGKIELTLVVDSLKELKEVRGFVYSPEKEILNKLLVHDIRLMRYHAKDSLSTEAADTISGTATELPEDTLGEEHTPVLQKEVEEEILKEEIEPQSREEENAGVRKPQVRPRPTSQAPR